MVGTFAERARLAAAQAKVHCLSTGISMSWLEGALMLGDQSVLRAALAIDGARAEFDAPVLQMVEHLCVGNYEAVVASEEAQRILCVLTNGSAGDDGAAPAEVDAAAARERGNALFKAMDYAAAATAYLQALEALDAGAVGGAAGAIAAAARRSAEQAGDAETKLLLGQLAGLPEEQQTLRISCLLNRAACCLKLGHNVSALAHCDDVLKLDAANTKAWFRRAKAHLQLEQLAQAYADSAKAAKLAPKDKAVRELHRHCQAAQQAASVSAEQMARPVQNPRPALCGAHS